MKDEKRKNILHTYHPFFYPSDDSGVNAFNRFHQSLLGYGRAYRNMSALMQATLGEMKPLLRLAKAWLSKLCLRSKNPRVNRCGECQQSPIKSPPVFLNGTITTTCSTRCLHASPLAGGDFRHYCFIDCQRFGGLYPLINSFGG
jgi:hypothetical protein